MTHAGEMTEPANPKNLCKSRDVLDGMRTCRGMRAHFDDWPMTDAHRGRHALQNCAFIRILDIPEGGMAKNICAPVDPARAAVFIHLGTPSGFVQMAAAGSDVYLTAPQPTCQCC